MKYNVYFTSRAILDLDVIKNYSENRWGKLVAKKYLTSIEKSILLISLNPDILREKEEVSRDFSFYRIREHLLVAIVENKNIIVLTIKYASMNLSEKIGQLEPSLRYEAEMLIKEIKGKR